MCVLLTTHLSFLLTSSEANYAIIMNGTPADSDRNITQFGVLIIAENGASCDPTVSLKWANFHAGLSLFVCRCLMKLF